MNVAGSYKQSSLLQYDVCYDEKSFKVQAPNILMFGACSVQDKYVSG